MKVKCEYCEGEFEAKRGTARYCSVKCRVNAAREVSVTGIDQKDGVSVTKSEVSVTDPRVSVTSPDELVTLRDTFYGHHIKVGVVPLHWQADKQAAALVKAKIPHYPQEAVDGRYDRDKVADIW